VHGGDELLGRGIFEKEAIRPRAEGPRRRAPRGRRSSGRGRVARRSRWRAAAKPSIVGIRMSMMTRPGRSRRLGRSPAWPS